jgi:hypothetical protein
MEKGDQRVGRKRCYTNPAPAGCKVDCTYSFNLELDCIVNFVQDRARFLTEILRVSLLSPLREGSSQACTPALPTS